MVNAPEMKETVAQEIKDVVEKKDKVTVLETVEVPEDREKLLSDAQEKFTKGKRLLLQDSVKQATEELGEACTLAAKVHGDMGTEMCSFYYHYGTALLDLARIEDNVLGNALTGVPEGDDVDNSQVEDPDKMTEEERETVAKQVDEALEENFKSVETSKEKKEEESSSKEETNGKEESMETDSKVEESNGKEDSKEAEETKDKEETEATNGKDEDKEESKMETEETKEDSEVASKDTKDETEKSEEKETEEAEEEEEEEVEEEGETEEGDTAEEGDTVEEDSQEEEVANLQLAWEILDLCRTIYLKQEDKSREDKVKLSQVYLKLGEVAMENDNYTDSVENLKECLKLQQELLSADDRCLAETYYQLGLAHSFADDFDDALENMAKAVAVIETRLTNNKQKLEKDDVKITEEMDMTPLSEEQKSLVKDYKELEVLLPQLKEKTADIKETKASFTEKLKSMKAQLMGEIVGASSSSTGFGESSSTSSDAKPIATSMIRKKRKPEEEVEAESESKKAKTETNGTEAKEQMEVEKATS